MKSYSLANCKGRGGSGESGMTLIEVLVAVTVFSVILIATLVLYDRAQRAYVTTEAETVQQQNTRFAMDQLVNAVRDIGVNVNPTGQSVRADEQLEGAFEAAIFVRGDFDGSRETTLQGSGPNQFPMVTTGNDEIVGYVLTKPGANSQTITLGLDLTGTGGSPTRDAAIDASTNPPTVLREETVSVSVAATTVAQQSSPPYRLERVTFSPTGAVVSQVVAENIFRLQFEYFNQGSATAVAASSLGSADPSRLTRRNVRRIAVHMIGMSSRPDLAYVDNTTWTPAGGVTGPSSVPASTRMHRKFALSEEIWSTNLGLRGRAHHIRPTAVIDPPNFIQACVGSCNSIVLNWGTVTGISTYKLHVTAPAMGGRPLIDTELDISGTSNRYDVPEIPPNISRPFTFQVKAVDAGGTTSAYSASVTVYAREESGNTPQPVGSAVSAGAGTPSGILARWSGVTQNENALANNCVTSGVGGTQSQPPPDDVNLIDLKGYEVYRVLSNGANANFAIGTASRMDGASMGAISNAPTSSTPSLHDRLAAPCENYFYKVRPVDRCAFTASAASPAMSSPATYTSTDAPTTPTGLQSLSSATSSTDPSYYDITLRWNPVNITAGGNPVVVARYVIERDKKIGNGSFVFDQTIDVTIGSPTEPHQYLDTVRNTDGVNALSYRYRIKARYSCGPESAYSGYFTYPCPTTGTVVIQSPAAGTTIDPPTTLAIVVRVTGTWHGAEVRIVDNSTTPPTLLTTFSSASTVSNGDYNFPWSTGPMNDTTLTISATARQDVGGVGVFCYLAAAPRVVAVVDIANCFTMVSSPAPGFANSNKNLEFRIRNNCNTTQRITGVTLEWTGMPSASAGNFVKKIFDDLTEVFDAGAGAFSGTRMNFNRSGSQILVVGTSNTQTMKFVFDKELVLSGVRADFPSILIHTDSVPNGEQVGPLDFP